LLVALAATVAVVAPSVALLGSPGGVSGGVVLALAVAIPSS
jgi:hypothetical protein